jgi:K+-sensing histidine kinase KdpD
MTTKEKGMGIGLAVSRSIVEAHGGRLWAENKKAGGAIFNVALPPAESEIKLQQSHTTNSRALPRYAPMQIAICAW